MRAVALALLGLFACQAWAQESDRPSLVQVKSGTVLAVDDDKEELVAVGEGVFLNEPGFKKLDRIYTSMQTDIAEKTVQNDLLRKKVDELAAKPSVSPVVVVVLIAGALVTGAAAGATAVYLWQK